ncbi:methionine--tRNA ligase [Streptomyces yokosukanensis]|uniref:Methionine--tRNA ligase n=1 Tax=Streptomyces yokosukanensis TaxID=67386 RepID=A0A101NWA6_9ACTN|nr:class I tRNA ligase family protein [Streptomyces yokosukanensis]KUN00455.1 methionine--tRNA ligase [Streptomyces yokosukanensis]
MIISTYDTAALRAALGIEMAGIEGAGVGAGWGRVAPGRASDPDRHDETEVFVVTAGSGDVVVDGRRREVAAGSMIVFEPFETHVLQNTGEEDLVFLTLYWRDAERAAGASTRADRLTDRPQFVFSTPPTPNGDLHLGHLSGPYLGADAYVRFQRMNGAQAWHLTGSDDYQSYVEAAARRDGHEPADTAAHYSAEIAATLRLMDIEPDQYTATHAEGDDYRDGLRDFFSQLVASGGITAEQAPALFDASGRYLYEVDVTGVCPTCSSGTSGNICEECGEPNSVVDLSDPVAATDGRTPTTGTVTRYMLPLHEHRADIEAHHGLGRVPARLRELAHRVFRRGRHDVAVTHPSTWGVQPSQTDVPAQSIWVWPEMAYGFLHGIQSLGRRLDRPWKARTPEDDWKIVHFFGYDNSFYHSVLYPALYRLAHPGWKADIDYHVNEFYLLEGSKFSTSRRHAIWGKDILTEDSVDAVRYFLARTRPEGRRSDFRSASFTALVEADLIGTWQQWLNQVGERVAKEYDGTAPDAGMWRPEHSAFLNRLETRRRALTTALGPDGFSLNQAAEELHGLVQDAVRFSREEGSASGIERWSSEARTTMALELAAARLLAQCAAPVVPRFAKKLALALGDPEPLQWPRTVRLLEPGTPVDLSETVFFTPVRLQGADAA